MDIVVICNGLGNQMSQYAFYLNKKKLDSSTRFIFDRRSLSTHNGYELKRAFGIEYTESISDRLLFYIFRFLLIERIQIVSRPLKYILKTFGIVVINERPNYDFDAEIIKPARGIRFFYGGWHSEKNFNDVKNLVISTFKFCKTKQNEIEVNLLEEIRNTNSVSIHVRRGDFLTGINKELYGSICTPEYFKEAIKKILSLVENPHFYVFSNDVDWVKTNLNYENLTVVDFNHGQNSWIDMYLMSKCKHNINSNSTFSWWGAWLNSNPGKIIVVPQYFLNNVVTKDFYPEKWLKITGY